MHLRYLIKPVCVQYGRLFSQKKCLSYPAQQGERKGFVKGESVPLDPVLAWGPRRVARPDGERRSGGALEGCPMRKRGDPTWSVARDDAQEQKKRHGGEPYRL